MHKQELETPISQNESVKKLDEKRIHNAKSTSDKSLGGLILVDKIFELLQAALESYNSILATQEDLPH